MKRTTFAIVVALAFVGMGLPAMAYHIDNAKDLAGAVTDPAVGTTNLGSADWTADPFGTIDLCESEWGAGTGIGGGDPGTGPADDRNSNPPFGNHGQGGLCTTGENDATGLLPPSQCLADPAAVAATTYFPGSTVSMCHADVGKGLIVVIVVAIIICVDNPPPGPSANDALYYDADGNGVVSPGDFRYSYVTIGAVTLAPGTVGGADADLGTASTCGWVTGQVDNGPAGPDASDDLYADLDASGTVSAGDFRFSRVDAFAGQYVRLDTCDTLTFDRNGMTWGPYAPAAPCPSGGTGEHAWFASFGPFTCFIPAATVAGNHAFYYDRLMAWWEYDGGGPYTPGDGAGMPHSGDGDSTANPLGVSNNEDGFHGHATMFISLADSDIGASTSGSAEASLAGDGTGGAEGEFASTVASDCGGSPGLSNFDGVTDGADLEGIPVGPAFIACYQAVADPIGTGALPGVCG